MAERTTGTWVNLTLAETRALCAAGELITRGPLNDTYVGIVSEEPVFIRHRVLIDDQYGQTFAAERLLPATLRDTVPIPTVRQIVTDEENRERFAIFEHIDGTTPEWNSSEVLFALASVLACVHGYMSESFGNLGGSQSHEGAEPYLRSLIEDEVTRLRSVVEDVPFVDKKGRLAIVTSCFESEKPTLCHGDVHAGNWMQDRTGRVWAVDWEAARYRVSAADFNQLHLGWLSPVQQRLVLDVYLELTGRDKADLLTQIAVLRFLWHLRTFNFHVIIRGMSPNAYREHLDAAAVLYDTLRSR